MGCHIRSMSRSPLIFIDGTLNSDRYISVVLKPVALPFIRGLQNVRFKEDHKQPHLAVVWTFLDIDNVRLWSWPARSLDFSPIENVRSKVTE